MSEKGKTQTPANDTPKTPRKGITPQDHMILDKPDFGHVYKSYDNGKTWEELDPESSLARNLLFMAQVDPAQVKGRNKPSKGELMGRYDKITAGLIKSGILIKVEWTRVRIMNGLGVKGYIDNARTIDSGTGDIEKEMEEEFA